MLEGDVDSCVDEGRCEDETADLHAKSNLIERIFVHHDTTAISDGFRNTADGHDIGEKVRLKVNAVDGIVYGEEGEECDEKGVEWERWIVAVDCVIDWAFCRDGSATEVDKVLPHGRGPSHSKRQST